MKIISSVIFILILIYMLIFSVAYKSIIMFLSFLFFIGCIFYAYWQYRPFKKLTSYLEGSINLNVSAKFAGTFNGQGIQISLYLGPDDANRWEVAVNKSSSIYLAVITGSFWDRYFDKLSHSFRVLFGSLKELKSENFPNHVIFSNQPDIALNHLNNTVLAKKINALFSKGYDELKVDSEKIAFSKTPTNRAQSEIEKSNITDTLTKLISVAEEFN